MVIDNFDDFHILQVFKKGEEMYDGKTVKAFNAPEIDPYLAEKAHDTFHLARLSAEDFAERRPRGIIGMGLTTFHDHNTAFVLRHLVGCGGHIFLICPHLLLEAVLEMTYRLICDSCTDLPPELVADPHVKKVPLSIQIGAETVVDGPDFRRIRVSRPFLRKLSRFSNTKRVCIRAIYASTCSTTTVNGKFLDANSRIIRAIWACPTEAERELNTWTLPVPLSSR